MNRSKDPAPSPMNARKPSGKQTMKPTAQKAGKKMVDPETIRRLPFIFDALDTDQSGFLDKAEVMAAVRRLPEVGLDVPPPVLRVVGTLMQEAEAGSGQGLNRQSFGMFLYRFSNALHVPLDRLANSLMEAADANNDEEWQYKVASKVTAAKGVRSRRTSAVEFAADAARSSSWDDVPELFHKWDMDSSGSISRHEVSVALHKFEPELWCTTFAEVMDLFNQANESGGHELSEDEFTTFLASFAAASGTPLDNVVTFLMSHVGDHAYERDAVLEGWKMSALLFDSFDENKDGTIDQHELVDHMSSFIQEMGVKDVSLEDLYEMLEEENGREIDRREFGFFLATFAKRADVSLDEVSFYVFHSLKKRRGIDASARGVRRDERMSLHHMWCNVDNLFSKWDLNDDGFLDHREVGMALHKYCTEEKYRLSSSCEYLDIVDDVSKQSGMLCAKGFVTFLSRYALAVGVELEELNQHLENMSNDDKEECETGWRSGGKSIFARLMHQASIGMDEEAHETKKEVKRMSERSRMSEDSCSSFSSV